jgi:hypothetical protein
MVRKELRNTKKEKNMIDVLLTQENEKDILNLIKYAEENKLDLAYMDELQMKQRLEIPIETVGDDDKAIIMLPLDFKVVFSIEEHPLGWCRHISISKNGTGNIDMYELVFIMSKFGFTSTLEDGKCYVYSEEYNINGVEYSAVNIIEKK